MIMAPDIPLRLALLRTDGIGPATWARLVMHLGPPEAWRSADSLALGALLNEPQWRAIEKTLCSEPQRMAGVCSDLAWLQQPGHALLCLDQPGYPSRLAAIHQPPPLLFVRGDPASLGLPQLAVVGTRHPTRHAVQDCHDFCIELARRGLVITSGLALGIDATAHLAALEAGGRTLAVLAHGLDSTYPPRHQALAMRVAEQGALVSEHPVGIKPRPDSFPRRNRLISGLSLGVWVVEGALKSGSMITAREALEQGREVFALPGSIRNPLTRGCHRLIRQGALLVESPEDIWAELPLQSRGEPLIQYRSGRDTSGTVDISGIAEEVPASILARLSCEYRTADDLACELGLPVQEVLTHLSMLVLEGRVHYHCGRYAQA